MLDPQAREEEMARRQATADYIRAATESSKRLTIVVSEGSVNITDADGRVQNLPTDSKKMDARSPTANSVKNRCAMIALRHGSQPGGEPTFPIGVVDQDQSRWRRSTPMRNIQQCRNSALELPPFKDGGTSAPLFSQPAES